MARGRVVQRRFTQGELDPEMLGRADIEQFYGAVSRGLNVFAVPQGGLVRAPGLAFVDEVLGSVARADVGVTITTPNGGTGANANDDDEGTELTTTTFVETADPYEVVRYDLGASARVGYVRVKGLRCNTGTLPSVFVQTSPDGVVWTSRGDEIELTTTGQSFTVRVQNSARYVRLVRIGDATNYPATTVTLQEFNVWLEGALGKVRLVNFEFSTELTYLLVITEFNIAVYRDNNYIVDVYAPSLFESKLDRLKWTQSANTIILVEETLQPQLVQRVSEEDWTIEPISFDFIPKYDFNPVTTNPAVNITPDALSGVVKLTASSSLFVSGDVNQVIEGNGGRARIVKYINGTTVSAYMEIPFFSTDVLQSGTWDFLKGFESVWGGGNGWPRSATFFEGRLWFGGSQARPRTVWGSRVNLFFDFDPGTALDDDAVVIDVQGSNNELNTIVDVFGGQDLHVLTTGSSYAFLKSVSEAITPTNAYLPPQSSSGAQDGLSPFSIEGVVYYVQRGGSALLGSVFSDSVNAYQELIASKLSSHLIKSPVRVARRRATSTDEGAYALLVSDDGNLTVANISSLEGISAFTERNTNGSFIEVATVFDQMYFVVDRTIGGVPVKYIERFDFNNLFDASIRITENLPSQTFSGLGHLNGETVKVKADGFDLDDVTINNGQATISRTASEYVEFGFNFTPVITDLPAQLGSETGSMSRLGRNKRVSEIHARVYQTTSLEVNGQEINFNRIQGLSNAAATPPYTGVISVFGNKGWSEDGTITITQSSPGSMQILEVSKKVNV